MAKRLLSSRYSISKSVGSGQYMPSRRTPRRWRGVSFSSRRTPRRWRGSLFPHGELRDAGEGLFFLTENSARLERVSFPSRRTPRGWRGSLFLHGELRGAGEGLFSLTENSAALAQPCMALFLRQKRPFPCRRQSLQNLPPLSKPSYSLIKLPCSLISHILCVTLHLL